MKLTYNTQHRTHIQRTQTWPKAEPLSEVEAGRGPGHTFRGPHLLPL